MTEILDRSGTSITVPTHELVTAARELSQAGRATTALALLDGVRATDPADRAHIALAAADVEMQRAWFTDFTGVPARLARAEAMAAALDPDATWDLAFLRLRHDYATLILPGGHFTPGPEGKDPAALTELRHRASDLRDTAPDGVRRGWVHHYLGLIADNLFGEPEAAFPAFTAALEAGDGHDDLLTREALRHLGDHAHTTGDHDLALTHWRRAVSVGARGGAVAGTLSNLILLVLLARDMGDEPGSRALAREVARWADAIGAPRLAETASTFLPEGDPERR
ncbi:hypothetical protein Afil01_29220 [Actinorhabdospora filicis]|uniref:Tetratricopeptide repeat protein n=1 Tax=Actinorhabdospora filicis TaxID=1785913 RepID=A0A9W6SJB5_9ACTN|nr:hypothetical protein [Actinorhabdospora filicis]GLZ78115.1 hypothetical protein Afil01_29220 [Actinorhabdospora filicis]